jgi:hypothetical protein
VVRVTALLAILAPTAASATAQAPDKILLRGAELDLYATPLETHPRLRKQKEGSTACHRGYVASWELKDGALWLRSLVGCEDDEALPIAKVVKGARRLPLRATWFTGSLLIPQGKQLDALLAQDEQEYDDYPIVSERQLRIAVVRGVVVGERTVDARPRKPAATPPLSAEELARALEQPRKLLAACKGAPPRLRAKVEVWKHGAPRFVTILDKLPRVVRDCVDAAIWVGGAFPARGKAYTTVLSVPLTPTP